MKNSLGSTDHNHPHPDPHHHLLHQQQQQQQNQHEHDQPQQQQQQQQRQQQQLGYYIRVSYFPETPIYALRTYTVLYLKTYSSSQGPHASPNPKTPEP